MMIKGIVIDEQKNISSKNWVFEIATIIAVLAKITERLNDSITIKVVSKNQVQEIDIIYAINFNDTFNEIVISVSEQLNLHLDSENLDSLKLLWIAENDSNGYEINFNSQSLDDINFNCSPNSFWELIFKNLNNYLDVFVNEISQNKNMTLNNISILSASDIETIINQSHGTYNETIAKPTLLHYLFEETVNKFPNNNALVIDNTTYNYLELNQEANKLAHYFLNKGVTKGDFIGIHLKRNANAYICMLATLKCGAAYVPIDSGYPADRVSFILNDSGCKFLISEIVLKENHFNYDGKILYAEIEIVTELNKSSQIQNPKIEIEFNSPAYVIYTSGSTGKPKGVVIPHKSISNLVKAEKEIFALSENEKIAQGFSTAFDASLEEIWLAFASGSTLYPVSEEVMHSGADVSNFISQNKISVFSTVPTMLSMLSNPLPSLKLLILGGENCPNDLLLKWHSPSLRITNTYGPTESTVIASYADFNPKEKITIGKPVINYAIFMLNSSHQLCPVGLPGELCIAGNGLATGYLNRNDLTNEKFILPNFDVGNTFKKRIYKSGDLARYNADGNIEFLGRIDTQVKLRGYRIELAEIETIILQDSNVKNAVVSVKEDVHKVQHLVAYLILIDKTKFDEEHLKAQLKTKLAIYMVPSLYMPLDEFPILSSGKVNRKALPEPIQEPKVRSREVINSRNKFEEIILKVWQEYLLIEEISVTDDFFDLGGHSLLASVVVSQLRKTNGFEQISIQDIYTQRSIEKLAKHLKQGETQNNDAAKNATEKKQPKKVSTPTYVTVTALQVVSFFLFIMVSSTGFLSPFIIEKISPNINEYKLITYSSLLVISTFPALLIVSILVKWIVIGKFKKGRYPLWSFYYFRFWFVKKFVDITPIGLLAGTPFLNMYFRLLGAKIGKCVYLGTDRIRMFDLLEIEDSSSIAKEAHLTGYTIENGELIIGSIKIGENCFVGTRSVLSLNTVMKNNSSLGDLSLLTANASIPENQHWKGAPAKQVEESIIKNTTSAKKLKRLPYIFYLTFQLFALIFLILFPLALMIPFGLTFYELDLNYGFLYACMASIPLTAIYIFIFCVFIAFVKWVIIGKTKEEDFSIYSFRYIQKWIVDMILHFVLVSFKSIYATIFLPSWLRLMGAKVGKQAEISTVNQLSSDLLEVGAGSFLADSVSVGSPDVRDGIMYLRKTVIGSRTFIGNSAVIACGDVVGDDCLIGVLSVPPKHINKGEMNGTSWLGSPPLFLPRRQPSEQFDDKLTFNPTKLLFFKRGVIEFFKISLPLAFTTMIFLAFYKLIYDVLLIESFGVVVVLAPFILTGLILITPLITVVFKKILIGKYKPQNKPLWSTFVWCNELVNSLCESMVYPLLVNMLLGTPLAPVFFRMMGSKIGKRVFMETTEITEFDLVNIEDDVCLNQLATIQTHLFEDRVMKMSNLYIKKGCNVGAMAVVLYDATMQTNSSIEDLTLVMKGETIPCNTMWIGSPAKFFKNK